MQRPDLVPVRGVAGEVGAGLADPVLADVVQPLAVSGEFGVGGVHPVQNRLHQTPLRLGAAKAVEHPGPVREALDQPGFAEQLQVARDARLAVAEDLHQFGDRQLLVGQQRQHAQPRRFARRAKPIHHLSRVRPHRASASIEPHLRALCKAARRRGRNRAAGLAVRRPSRGARARRRAKEPLMPRSKPRLTKPLLVARLAGALALAAPVMLGGMTTPALAQAIRGHGDPSAEAYVQTEASRAIAILNDRNMGAAAKRQAFYSFVNEAADVPRITNFVLGRYRRQITPAQYQQFSDIFRRYADSVYESRLGEYHGEGLRVTGSAVHAPGDVVVSSDISGGDYHGMPGGELARDAGTAGLEGRGRAGPGRLAGGGGATGFHLHTGQRQREHRRPDRPAPRPGGRRPLNPLRFTAL